MVISVFCNEGRAHAAVLDNGSAATWGQVNYGGDCSAVHDASERHVMHALSAVTAAKAVKVTLTPSTSEHPSP